jgi:hypothetical protein
MHNLVVQPPTSPAPNAGSDIAAVPVAGPTPLSVGGGAGLVDEDFRQAAWCSVGGVVQPGCVIARVPHPGGYRVLELTAGLVVISIAFTPDLRD